MNKNEVREQIQNDLDCLFDGLEVSHFENSEGKTLLELTCEIVCENFKKLDAQDSNS